MSAEILHPSSISEALAALTAYGDEARPLAGGTALVLLIRQGLIAPRILICLEEIPELHGIREVTGGLWIGPMVRLQEVTRALAVRRRLPVLAAACSEVGNLRIRNQATLGGNLAEADYASDPPIALMVLEACIEAQGPKGKREIPIADFFHGPYATALAPGELISGIRIPDPPSGARMAYLKFRTRSAEDRPCVGVAALAVFVEGICTDLRVAVGAACEIPQRLPDLEREAIGTSLSDPIIRRIAAGYAERIETLGDLRGSAAYRKAMIEVHVRRALKEVRDGYGPLHPDVGR
jgi:carbon-monoxide dehydrogenase medium subunit